MNILGVTESQWKAAKTLGERLRKAMTARGLTTPALAAKIGVERQTVHYWLDGTTKTIDTKNLVQAAKILQVRQEWLCDGEWPPIADDRAEQLVIYYHAMSPEKREALLGVAEAMADRDREK